MTAFKTKAIIEEISHPLPPAILFSSIKDRDHPFFLDSSCDHKKLGRYSFMGCDPFLVFSASGNRVTIKGPGGTRAIFGDPFVILRGLLSEYDSVEEDERVPFISGAAGYFSYDMKDHIEDLPDIADDDIGIPDCVLGFHDTVLTYDNLARRAYIASTGLPEKDPEARIRKARRRLEEFKTRLNAPLFTGQRRMIVEPEVHSNTTKGAYCEMVRRAKAYIEKGDIYQVNLSHRFKAGLNMEAFELYKRLRNYSPAPFSSYIGFGDCAILSSSPERFLMKKGRYVETRPIKGTRPRGEDRAGDVVMETELSRSAKDMAEHLMIVDLERNDLGKVCEYGSVAPAEFNIIERYANVFHLVSTVSGRLKEGVSAVDCLVAAFPGGSITGAPKVRSMEIIEELEVNKRSLYTGGIGYITFGGDMDTSIAIRTFLIDGNDVFFSVGGGIVADSQPDDEYEETMHKAKGMFSALGVRSALSLASARVIWKMA